MSDSRSALGRLLAPGAVAVIGASDRRANWGTRSLRSMVDAGFAGRLFAVNPSAPPGERDGFEMVPSLSAIDDDIDAVLISVGRDGVLDAVRDCAGKRVGVAVIVASGFGELGEDGRELEQEILSAARQGGVRLVGPNCIGVYSAAGRVYFGPRPGPPGSVALLTQSGNFSIALAIQVEEAGLGLSSCVGVGNQLDLGFGELLAWFATDPATSAVAMYLEGLPHTQVDEFLRGLQACQELGKAVVVLKAGRSARGAGTAATHTGSLASDDRVWQAVLEATGSVQVDSLDAMTDALVCAVRVPRHAGRVAVVTDGGGDSVMAVDALYRNGLRLADLDASTQAALAPLIPPLAPRHPGLNPMTLDTPGGLQDEPLLLADVAEILSRDPGVDALVVGGNFGSFQQHRAEELEAVTRLLGLAGPDFRILVQAVRSHPGDEPIQLLRDAGVPVFSSLKSLVTGLATRHVQPTDPRAAAQRDPERNVGSSPEEVLGPEEAVRLLERVGISCPPLRLIRNPAEIDQAISDVGLPACLKVSDPRVLHKSDVGGVRLGLGDVDAVAAAASELWAKFPDAPLLVMPMLAPGFELLVGLAWDETFGAVLLVGRGGIWTEVEDDVVVIPLQTATPDGIAERLRQLRCYPMLAGHRGQSELDLSALRELLSSMVKLADSQPGIVVDLNPVILYRSGLAIADVRMLLPHSSGHEEAKENAAD